MTEDRMSYGIGSKRHRLGGTIMRLEGKVAVIVGAGQSPGEGIGNGRATVLRFAREGARVLAIDRNLASAEETAELVRKEGGECVAFEADVTKERTLARQCRPPSSAGGASTSCTTMS